MVMSYFLWFVRGYGAIFEVSMASNRLVTTASLEKYVPINIWWLESPSAAAIG